MSIINISGTTPVDDPNYRYKMPTVFGKIEGKGNGIKTVIVNITELAFALHRNPGEVNKHFGCEIGAQTTYNDQTDKAIVNGAHSDKVLQDCVHKYIQEFVLCPNCALPETDYKIKNGCIFHRCKACGAKDMVNMNHKLCAYILAQDKKAKKDGKKKGGKDKETKEADVEKEVKKKKKKEKDGDDEKKKEKKDKKKKDKKDKKKKDKKEKKSSSSEDDGEAELGSEEDSVATEDGVDDVGARLLAIEGIKVFMSENPDANNKQIADMVKNQQMSSALKSYERIHIFMAAAITSDFFKKKEIKKNAAMINLITNKTIEMQRHLIGAIEMICVKEPKHFPVMLKQLFDEEVLEEDIILEWAFSGRSDYTHDAVDEDTRAVLRGKAEPVVEWLQQESDSDSDSDSDDE
mmetsp:Transcript_6918/g.7554  ORF Transcript_6918/g.7554 Transcript_6918/m.7554 type:complete len:405 (-) Transcript_6918:174-1388(-)